MSDELDILDKTFQFVKEIKKHIKLHGDKKLRTELCHNAGLSHEDAGNLIDIIGNIVPDISYDALPGEWFFQMAPKAGKSNILKNQKDKIRREREEIQYTIKQFRDLNNDLKEVVLEWWPEEYHNKLQNKEIDDGDEIRDKFSETEIANEVLAGRYGSTVETINTYCKKSKRKRSVDGKQS
jgi:hypothetical protein